MPIPDQTDPLPPILAAERSALITQIAGRVQREIPDYQAVPLGVVTERYTIIVDAVIRSLNSYDPSQLTSVLGEAGRARLSQGYTLDALLTAATIVEESFADAVRRHLPGDPERQAANVRRVVNLVGTARHVLSRLNLDAVLKRGSGTDSLGGKKPTG
jgi:hypothetical protein